MPRPARDPVLAAVAAFEYRPALPEGEAPAWPPPPPDPYKSFEQLLRFMHMDLPSMTRANLAQELILAAIAARTSTWSWWHQRWHAVRSEWQRRRNANAGASD